MIMIIDVFNGIYLQTMEIFAQSFFKTSGMPKQIIISMEQNYPFGECDQCTSQVTRVLVRKIFKVNLQEGRKLLEKVKILRKLESEHMVKVESVMEEEGSIHFFYEYIPIKVQTWISNINDHFIENFRDQLIKFFSYLANNGIRIDFSLKNVGMDHDYQAKYYLDLNFQINSSTSKEKLKSAYIRDISNLFRPYLEGNRSGNRIANQDQCTGSPQNHKNMIHREMGAEKKQNSQKESYEKAKGAKPKALERYYQEANISVDYPNEQLLKEFINVLDDEEQEQQTQQEVVSPVRFNPFQTHHPTEYHSPLPTQNSSVYFNRDATPSSTSSHIVSSMDNPKQSLNSTQSPLETMKFMKSCSIGRDTMDYTQFARGSIEIQSRVKTVIEKSRTAIKKFKQISNTVRR